jgi:hypothetical protein
MQDLFADNLPQYVSMSRGVHRRNSCGLNGGRITNPIVLTTLLLVLLAGNNPASADRNGHIGSTSCGWGAAHRYAAGAPIAQGHQ